MSVELDPVELGFRRPFNREVSQVLRLRNPHPEPVAFKVKTTAPKQYCVRPNSGRIDAGGDIEVQVLLQAMKEEPPADAKCRDKFLVQSVAIAADQDFNNISSLWTTIEQTNKSSIQEKKIRVTFLPADGSSETNSSSHAVGNSNSTLSTPARDGAQHGGTFLNYTPGDNSRLSEATATPPQGGAPVVGPVSNMEDKPTGSKNLGEIRQEVHNPATDSRASTGAATGSTRNTSTTTAPLGTMPTSVDDVRAQLAEAQATIARMTSEAQEGLRRRNIPGTSTTVGDAAASAQSNLAQAQHQVANNGISLQVTAGLCLLSFLLAYFFF